MQQTLFLRNTPHPNHLMKQLAIPLSQQAGKWLVIPQAGRGNL
jgi:hypothetical protein